MLQLPFLPLVLRLVLHHHIIRLLLVLLLLLLLLLSLLLLLLPLSLRHLLAPPSSPPLRHLPPSFPPSRRPELRKRPCARSDGDVRVRVRLGPRGRVLEKRARHRHAHLAPSAHPDFPRLLWGYGKQTWRAHMSCPSACPVARGSFFAILFMPVCGTEISGRMFRTVFCILCGRMVSCLFAFARPLKMLSASPDVCVCSCSLVSKWPFRALPQALPDRHGTRTCVAQCCACQALATPAACASHSHGARSHA